MSKKPVLLGSALVVALVVLAMVVMFASGPSQPPATVVATPVMTATPVITAPTATATSTPSATPVAFSLKLVEDEAKIAELRARFVGISRPVNPGDRAPDLEGGFFAVEVHGFDFRSLPGGSATYQSYLRQSPRSYGFGFDDSRVPGHIFVIIPGGASPGTYTLEFAPPGQTPAKVTFEVKAK